MKKSNKKGFTLVELIIVSTIMVMIMGAILNFIQPMNRFYTRTLYNSDSNDVGNQLMDKVEDEIRYSTNVAVIKDYEGVPKVKDGYLINASGDKALSAKFTNVLVIDNNDFRSYEDNVAHRKGAKGYISKYTLKDSVTDPNLGYDLDSKIILGTADLYSDMMCTFSAKVNSAENSNQCVEISMDLKKPEVGSGGGYVFSKTVFTQTRDVKLVNINLQDAGLKNMKVSYSDPTVDADMYSNYVKSNAPVGYSLDEGTEARYNGDHKYTYIFYTLAVTATNPNQKLKITVYEDGTTNVIGTITDIKPGSNIQPTDVTNMIALAKKKESKTPMTGGYMWKTYDGILSAIGDYDLADYVDKRTVDMNMDFNAKFKEEFKSAEPIGTITFWDCYDDSHNYTGSYSENRGSHPVYSSGNDPSGNNNKIPAYPTGNAEPYLELDGWYTGFGGTGIKFTNDLLISHNGDWAFYAYYKPGMTMNFYEPDGTTLIDSFEYRKNVSGKSILESPLFDGKILSKFNVTADQTLYWDVEGEGQTLDNIGNLSGDSYNMIARVEDIPPPPPAKVYVSAISVSALNYSQELVYKFSITNDSTSIANIKQLKVETPYSHNFSRATGGMVKVSWGYEKWFADYMSNITSDYIIFYMQDGNVCEIQPGQTIEGELYLYDYNGGLNGKSTSDFNITLDNVEVTDYDLY